jgi:hypothetical protein
VVQQQATKQQGAQQRAAGTRLGPRQAAQLWVAADFFQVDGLQCACEDDLAAALAAAAAGDAAATGRAGAFAELLGASLALCVRHPASSGRLRPLIAREFLRAASAAPVGCLDPRLAAAAAARLGALLPGVLAELRDRLVALCVLNAGRGDADSPEEAVG